MESTRMILEVTLMTTLNRRRFVEVAGSSLLFESVHARGFPLPARAQRFLLHMGQSEKNNPYGSVIQKLERMTGVAITGWKTHADNLPHPEAVTLDDSNWQDAQPVPGRFGRAAEHSSGEGAAWFRKLIVIPESLGGYRIHGLPVLLNLRVFSRTRGAIRVFSKWCSVIRSSLLSSPRAPSRARSSLSQPILPVQEEFLHASRWITLRANQILPQCWKKSCVSRRHPGVLPMGNRSVKRN